MRSFVIVADDIGLSRGSTDTILQAADVGALQGVSILANGEALAYACEELLKRPSLALALHCNLTEGKPLSAPQSIPLLVDADGFFKHSVLTLWASYLLSISSRRTALRMQVSTELAVQFAALKRQGVSVTRADGHQHVHILPFVFDALAALPGISRVRLPREPLYIGPEPLVFCKRILPVAVLNLLCRRALCTARARGVMTNDYVLGVRYSGHMSAAALAAGLASLPTGDVEVEVILHPGSAKEGELKEWRASGADTSWHYSPWRADERALLVNGLREVLSSETQPSSLLRGLLGGILRMLPLGAPQWIYTTLLRPRPLRSLAHLLLRRVIPPTLVIEEGTLMLNQDDPVVSAALALGVYEPGIVQKWRELLRDDSQVLDIGANIGLFTLVAARRASHGTVIAFEPQKENAQFLSRMIARNALTNIVTVTAGASDKAGQASLYLHPDNKGMHSLLPVGDVEERIPLVCADDIVAQYKMSPMLIKLDVEGWEAKALRGLEETLRRCHPAILFEFAPARIRAAGDDPCALLTHLRDLGYSLTVLEENDGYQNILAV